MNTGGHSLTLFRMAASLWVACTFLSLVPAIGPLWTAPVSPALPGHGPFAWITQAFGTWLPPAAAPVAVCLVIVLAVRNVCGRPCWYLDVLVWGLTTSLLARAWLFGSGGQQLMSILLFWMIFQRDPAHQSKKDRTSVWRMGLSAFAFWAARIQVLVVYAVTAAHKSTGQHWLDGTAVHRVAADPTYDLAWLLPHPMLCAVLTWSLFAFMALFPVLIWWRPARMPLLFLGVLFHLSTALLMGIPEMGLAFVAAYALWLDEPHAAAILRKGRALVDRIKLSVRRSPGAAAS